MSRKEEREGYVLLPNSDHHNCFGCSPKNPSGLQMEFYMNGEMDHVASWVSVPASCSGWANIAHGGIIATILDETMGWAGLFILRKPVVSKSITVDYLKPIFLEQEVMVKGKIGRINSDREAVLEASIYDADKEVCAKSSSVVASFTIDKIRKMGVSDETTIDFMERLFKITSFEELKKISF